jgi:hypothetical protein
MLKLKILKIISLGLAHLDSIIYTSTRKVEFDFFVINGEVLILLGKDVMVSHL